MSSKKQNKNFSNGENGIRFLDNTSIKEYVSGNRIMTKAVKPIKEILNNEKCKEKHSFSTELALDLDQVEILRQMGTSNRGKTVDFVVGLENKQLLLVEAKFQVENVANIVPDFVGKLNHSKRILTGNPNFKNFYKKDIILLSQTNFQQNYHRLRTMLAGKGSNATEPQTVSSFYNTFFGK